MNTTELTGTLEAAGLSPYQATAYVTLLESGSISAQELAARSDVPGPRIYDVLDALEDQGYVVTYERDQLYAEALDPDTGLQSLESRIGQLQSAASEIRSRWRAPTTDDVDIGVVKRFRTVLEHTRERVISADHQVLLALTYPQLLELESALESAARRGVFVQVSLHSVQDAQFEKIDDSQFERVASEVRLGDTPCMYEPFLAIVDGTKVSFAPFSRDPGRGSGTAGDAVLHYGVLADDPIHAYVFEWYFLAALWEPSESIFTRDSSTPPMEFVDVREVIRAVDPLLREGATIRATVRGRRVSSGRQVSVDGRVVSVQSDRSASPDGSPMESLMTRRATIVLETDDGTVSVGGRGAYTEDVEAARFVITEIVEPE